MLVNVFYDSKAEHRRLFGAGLVFMVVLALLIALSVAIYDKRFTSNTTITVMAERAGLQLLRFGDVRVHGALVGYVEKIESDGREAMITVALQPEAARNLPSDIDVRIMPTTLFGQNYLELLPPEQATGAGPLTDGTVIPADRVITSVDIQTVLAELFPVLRTVDAANLNATLYALSQALRGKGDQLGETLVELGEYLDALHPELPTLREDLSLLAEVAETYELAAPELIGLLRNATVTARTLAEKDGDVERALLSLTGLAGTTRDTLSENEQDLAAQLRLARPLLSLLDTYSPQLDCLLTGLDRQIPDTQNVFQNDIIHQTLELGAPQRPAYTAADAPVFGEIGRGPWCLGLPDNHQVPAGFEPLRDGSDRDEPHGGIP